MTQHPPDQQYVASVILSDADFTADLRTAQTDEEMRAFILKWFPVVQDISATVAEAQRLGVANVANLRALYVYLRTHLDGDPRLEAVAAAYTALARAFNLPVDLPSESDDAETLP